MVHHVWESVDPWGDEEEMSYRRGYGGTHYEDDEDDRDEQRGHDDGYCDESDDDDDEDDGTEYQVNAVNAEIDSEEKHRQQEDEETEKQSAPERWVEKKLKEGGVGEWEIMEIKESFEDFDGMTVESIWEIHGGRRGYKGDRELFDWVVELFEEATGRPMARRSDVESETDSRADESDVQKKRESERKKVRVSRKEKKWNEWWKKEVEDRHWEERDLLFEQQFMDWKNREKHWRWVGASAGCVASVYLMCYEDGSRGLDWYRHSNAKLATFWLERRDMLYEGFDRLFPWFCKVLPRGGPDDLLSYLRHEVETNQLHLAIVADVYRRQGRTAHFNAWVLRWALPALLEGYKEEGSMERQVELVACDLRETAACLMVKEGDCVKVYDDDEVEYDAVVVGLEEWDEKDVAWTKVFVDVEIEDGKFECGEELKIVSGDWAVEVEHKKCVFCEEKEVGVNRMDMKNEYVSKWDGQGQRKYWKEMQ